MMNSNKYRFIVFLSIAFISFIIWTDRAEARTPDYNGGVMNEYTYEEIFFLESYPITFIGKPVVTERIAKDKITTTYRFNLTSKNGDKLVRNVVYETTFDNRTDKGQSTSQTTVKSYTEKITTTTNTIITLDDIQFTQSTVIDHRAASDFYSGDLIATKRYIVTRPSIPLAADELITVHMTGRNVGYENFWGATETQIIDYEIIGNNGTTLVTSKVSDSTTKKLEYRPHDPTLSSFTGGHIIIVNSDMVGEYTYSYPYYLRSGTIELSKQNTPTLQRLIVPKFQDLTNHWAKNSIEKLYSIGVFDESADKFRPGAIMTRYDFTIGVLKAVDTRVTENTTKKASTKSIFKDVSAKDKGYMYIESAVNQGIINGFTKELFKPDDPLTRAQAAAVLVRALGMEGRAPTSAYSKFADDRSIPAWARNSAYVANELGIIQGDANRKFNAQQYLTRAEASAMLQRFVDFLEDDLQKNYRDDVLNLN